MGDGIIGKFIAFWVFLLGGLVMGRVFGLTDTTRDVVVLCICLVFMFVGWMFIRSNVKKKSADRQAAPTPRNNNRHGKKKKR